ncbi:MAG: Holliday junction resolvase RuvX [Planctomycetes bacterium]|nr:Holliday junction resolvase RuvX [Planctomycetota bacterium]
MSARADHPQGGVLAIDHGTKRTGFAVTDALRLGVFALDPHRGDGQGQELLTHIAQLCDERTIATFLVGFPYDAEGREGGRAQDVRAFTERLARHLPKVEIVLYDERLTTKAAEELLREAGLHGDERKARRDSWSALVLLRDWIDSGEPRSAR